MRCVGANASIVTARIEPPISLSRGQLSAFRGLDFLHPRRAAILPVALWGLIREIHHT